MSQRSEPEAGGAPDETHVASDPKRPSDHIDSDEREVQQPALGFVGWLRWFWRQLTSMRTAILLLLLLAIAAVPGSLVPQTSSDPNGVAQYRREYPDLAPVLDWFSMFDVYTSPWFSAVYLLLFVSLIGCIIPRTKHHWQALRARPPRTPVRLSRLAGFREVRAPGVDAGAAIDQAAALLKQQGYRVERYELRGQPSVSAERGYLRETGNLVFHTALLGILVAVGVGGGWGFAGQRVIVEGQSFVNTLSAYDSFNPGRFFDDGALDPYRLTLDDLDAVYETENLDAYGQPIDFTATVEVESRDGSVEPGTIKVNEPLRTHGTDVFLLGNGYAPTVTVRDPSGEVVFSDSIPFLPQDANLTSTGVIKVTDGLDEQLGFIGFFYPTQEVTASGAYTSNYPDLVLPMLTLRGWAGDLGINEGTPKSVYELDPEGMTPIAGGDAEAPSIELMPGETAELPNGLGSITFEHADPDAAEGDYSHSVKRFASLDIHHDPVQGWVLTFAILILGGLMVSLFVPRRRVWVKARTDAEGTLVLEYAGLARGEDHRLDEAVAAVAAKHAERLGIDPAGAAGEDPAARPETSST